MSSRTVRMSSGGRLVIPVDIRRELNISDGTAVTLTLMDGEMRVRTVQEGIKRAQEIFAKYNKRPDVSIVDELIADRRAEALRDEIR